MAFYDPVAFTGLVVLQRNSHVEQLPFHLGEYDIQERFQSEKDLFPLFPQHFLLFAFKCAINSLCLGSVSTNCIKVLKAPMTSFSECFSEVLLLLGYKRLSSPNFSQLPIVMMS